MCFDVIGIKDVCAHQLRVPCLPISALGTLAVVSAMVSLKAGVCV